MKKILSVLLAAMLSVAMVSCGEKENEEKNNNQSGGGNNQGGTAIDNTLIYDGVTYTGESGVMFFENSLQYALYNNVENGFQVSGNIESSAYNRTFDLTQHHPDLMFSVHVNVGEILDMKYQNYPQNYWCFLNGESLEQRSCFTSGTATITVADNTLTIVVEGTLINGKEIRYKVVSTEQGHQGPVLSPNKVIIGSNEYNVVPVLNRNNDGDFLFGTISIGGNDNMNLIADIPVSMIGKTANIGQLSGNYEYFFNFSSPNLNFSQQLNADNPFARFNDEDLATAAFSEGMLEFVEETDAYTMTINGVLTDGTNFGAQLRVAKADIEAMDNQIILDGKPYRGEILGNLLNGTYTLNVSGYDDEITTEAAVVSVTFTFSPSEIGKTFDLTSATPTGSYAVNGSSLNTLGLEFVQTYTNGTFSSRFSRDDEFANVSLFSKGTLSSSEDEYAITVHIVGTLTNGHSLSAQLRIDKNEINQYQK